MSRFQRVLDDGAPVYTPGEVSIAESLRVSDGRWRISVGKQYMPNQQDLDPERNIDMTPDPQLTFYEWRGRRHAYLPLVESYFMFECYNMSAPGAHDLWKLLDTFLHDPEYTNTDGSMAFERHIHFGKLYVYFCLRSQIPQLYLETRSRLDGATTEFASAYRMMYSEQESA